MRKVNGTHPLDYKRLLLYRTSPVLPHPSIANIARDTRESFSLYISPGFNIPDNLCFVQSDASFRGVEGNIVRTCVELFVGVGVLLERAA